MLFKLSIKNMKKSFKDYAIYFITLVLGVAIFYMFNSLDSQESMLQVSKSTKQIIKLMIEMLSMVSVFVAVILGLLIVYANNFLINRRKKEFGIYMTLGMSKRQISKIIFLETIFVGIISLVVGLVCGVFISQFMSILVGKLFQADMSRFEFVFSKTACIKTCVFFAIMYLAVMIFNTFTISRYKLINLLTAIKKNETVKMKNSFVCIIVFAIAVGILSYCYYKVSAGYNTLRTINDILPIILMGIISTVLVFWSMSGFILKLVQANKNVYLKGTNLFVLRQMHNKINTTVISISVICLMLFVTITILSTALSLRNTMEKSLREMTPVDINLYKVANLPEKITRYGKEIVYTDMQRENSKSSVGSSLKAVGYDMSKLKDVEEISTYAINDITLKTTLGSALEEALNQYPMMRYDTVEMIIRVSDYNRIAKLYNIEEYSLNDNEYIILCNFDNISEIRNQALKANVKININGKDYVPKYPECKDGFIEISTSHTNGGIILVPDDCELKDEQRQTWFLAGNYNAKTEEQIEAIEKDFASDESELTERLLAEGVIIDGMTKINLTESSVGLATIVVFIAIYLGIIFLIASSAILALKQLTESSDNRQRYIILRKIGCDEKMINSSLFKQIGIFFMLPLIVAIIHSIFGIQFGINVMEVLASKEELLPSAIVTVAVISVIYGIYFMATYLESKNIIKED
ncbi:MAG: ABC transporter permease [Clostridia bacterium]|nr:ABC transporter permease [Clostridia bacterium]